MIKVISFKICPFFQQVLAVLEERLIKYEIEYYDSKTQCWFGISPNGRAPLLVTESGVTLFDSDAIINYIETKFPSTDITSLEEQAINKAWSLHASKNYVPQCTAMRSQREEDSKNNFKILHNSLEKIEKILKPQDKNTTSRFNSLDASWVVILHRAYLFEKHSGYDMLEQFPQLKLWQKSILKLDIVKKTISNDFETVFTDFYLSSKTFYWKK